MKLRTIKARNLALEKHKNQRYGIYPYEVHLTNVVSVLLHFGFTFEEDELIISAAWLHDIIEDTAIDEAYVSTHFGEEICEIVSAVSNHRDEANTKLENKRITFSKIAINEKAIIVKLADRIANVEFSILHENVKLINKYKKEQLLIDELVAPKITTEKTQKMYTHLKKMISL